MFNPAEYPEIPTRNDAADDVFFWKQGPTRGAAKVQFADWTPVYENHARHPERRACSTSRPRRFATLLATAAPDADQQKDLDFLLNVGHLFSLIVYGQLILEQAALTGLDDDMRRSDLRLPDPRLHHVCRCAARQADVRRRPSRTGRVGAIRKPVSDAERFHRVWQRVKAYDGAYEMRA